MEVDTAPLESALAGRNCGAVSASTGKGALGGSPRTGFNGLLGGRIRPVSSCVNAAVPSYLIVLRVIQCPPIENRSLIFRMPPKLTEKPVPVDFSSASAKSVPVGMPRDANVNGCPGTRWVE